MSKKSFSRHSLTDWERLGKLQDEEIDLSDIPEVTEAQMAKAVLRVGGKPVPKGKVRVSMLLDAEVVAFFKARAGARGYQKLINESLKANIRERGMEALLRRIIREELRAAKKLA